MSSEQSSFWKKEISLRRKPAQPEPQPEPQRAPLDDDLDEIKRVAHGVELPAPPSETRERIAVPPPPVEPEPVVETKPQARAAVDQPAQKTSVWKKEISFRRKPKTEDAEALEPESQPEAEAPTLEVQPEPKKKEKTKASRLPKLEARPGRIKRDKSGRPLPQRHKKLVGLKIGSSQIAAARVSNNGVAHLQQTARVKLDPGIVVGGELREPERLSEALKAFFKENKLPKRGVRLGVANNRIGVRTLEIVGIEDAKQLDNAIRFRAQEVLPIPIDEAVLDYRILDERRDDEGQSVKRVLLVVAYRELVDRYVVACNKAGIQLVGIDLEAFALLRALAAPAPETDTPDAAVVVVSVGHDRTTFAVSDGRECVFTRVLDWGGAALNIAIARALDIAPSEAEPYKLALDINGTRAPEGLTQDQLALAQDAILRQIQSFARDLVASLQFYQGQPDSLGIGEMVLTGGGAHLRGIADELERMIGVPVRVGDPLARVVVSKHVDDDAQIGSLAAAIGLGIED